MQTMKNIAPDEKILSTFRALDKDEQKEFWKQVKQMYADRIIDEAVYTHLLKMMVKVLEEPKKRWFGR